MMNFIKISLTLAFSCRVHLVVLLLLLACLQLEANVLVYKYTGNFGEFVDSFSKDHKLNILMSDTIEFSKRDIKINVNFSRISPEELFKSVCQAYGFIVKKDDDVISVFSNDIKRVSLQGVYIYEFVNRVFFEDEKTQIIDEFFESKARLYGSLLVVQDVRDDDLKNLEKVCKYLDKPIKRVCFKGVLLRTNETVLSDHLVSFLGDIEITKKINLGFNIGSLVNNYSKITLIDEFPFELYLKSLKANSEISRLTEFTMILDEGREFEIKDGSSRAYIKGVSQSAEGSVNNTEYEYKDDGIKIRFDLISVLNGYSYFDLDVDISKVVSLEGDQIPLTNGQKLKTSGRIADGKVFYVGGLSDESLEVREEKNLIFKNGKKRSSLFTKLVCVFKADLLES